MGPKAHEVLDGMVDQLKKEQAEKPSRERAVLITDLEKAMVWAKHHGL